MLRLSSGAVLALVACGGPPLPRPAQLDPAAATALAVHTTTGGDRYCVGASPPQLDVQVTLTDGRVLDTWSVGEGRAGRLVFSTFEWTATWGAVDSEGFVRVPDDPFAAVAHPVTVDVRIPDRPDLRAQVTLAPDFGCGGQLGALGTAGATGRGGTRGTPGGDGASDDGQHPPQGGGRGSDGSPGGPGGPGGPGPRVTAHLAFVDTSTGTRLAVLRVAAAGRVDTALFDPAGEPWTVVAFGGGGGSGGSGGDGGNGGRGGNGRQATTGTGSGASDTPGTDGANGGDGGNGGDAGDGGAGGAGGEITLTYDRRFPELAQLVRLDSQGGQGGGGGWAGNGGQGGQGGNGARQGRDGRPGGQGRPGAQGYQGPAGAAPAVIAGDVAGAFTDLDGKGVTLATP